MTRGGGHGRTLNTLLFMYMFLGLKLLIFNFSRNYMYMKPILIGSFPQLECKNTVFIYK